MGKGLIIGIVVLILIVGGFFLFRGGDDTSEITSTTPSPSAAVPAPGNEDVEEAIVVGGDSDTGEEEVSGSETHTVEITSSGYSPKTLTINSGDTVTWINMDSRTNWPASAVHPSHTVYPGSARSKCGSSGEVDIFDACRGLANGERFSFTFTEQGEWGYHNHLGSSTTGKIIVN